MNIFFSFRRNLNGIFLILLFSLLTSQFISAQQQLLPQPKMYRLAPGTMLPSRAHHHPNTNTGPNMKDLWLTDTVDALDYCTFDELIAESLLISFTGSWNSPTPQIAASELTSFVTLASYDVQKLTYAQVAFDSLAFASYTNQSTYSMLRAGSSVSLDSVGMFIGIYGDTVQADGTMAHDTLLISIYRVIGSAVSPTPVATIVNSGYSGLAPFLTGGTGYLKGVVVPVGQQFNPGESFAVRLTYLNKDTSSHCLLSYTYPDSCGTIVIQGQDYTSPAYPSVFPHSTSYGQIDSVAPGTATVDVFDNSYTYNLSNYGISTNCSYTYIQDWEIQAYVTVSVQYATQIQATPTTICNGSSVNLNALVFGTSSSTINYTWTVSSGTLSGANTATPTVTSTNNSNITVTVTVNDGTGNVTDSIVLINCYLNVNAGNSQTVCTGSNIILAPSVTGGTPPYTYQWQASAGSLSCQNCLNPSITVSQNATYTITVTDAAQSTATSSVSYTLNGNTNTAQLSLANSGISCNNYVDTTTVTVTGGTSPYTVNWGNSSITTGTSPQVFNYGLPAATYIVAVTDANGCITTVFDTVLYAGPTVSLVHATDPGCPNTPTGSILVSVLGGTSPYTYTWSPGLSSTDTLTNVSSGNYQVVVTDAHGCEGTLSYDLSSLRDYNYYVFLTTTNPNCALTGLVATAVSGGVLPYTYQWSDGETTANIQPIISNSYSLTVTDSLGCQTTGQTYISNYCQSIISGTAFYDSTGNCSLVNSIPVTSLFIIATSSTGDYFYGFTDQNGNYTIQVSDTGTYNLSTQEYFSTCSSLTFCGNSNQTVYLPVLGDSANNVNVGLTGSAGFNLGIHPGWTSADPGFIKQYWVFYYNSSPLPFIGPATVTFVYDSNLVYLSTDESPAPVVNTVAHTLTWFIDSVTGNDNWIPLDGYFQVPSTLSLNYLLQSSFTILPEVGDCDTSDNHYTYSETVIGSHDPNEKTVSPSGPVTESDSVLTYTIHFQNTGSDSTHFIIIKDTLSPYLDPATVRNIASSDKYSSFTVSGKGILTWTFNPLRVVDSATNPSGSKRFIMFTVNKRGGLPIGTNIANTASVYFDYNNAVVTNTVTDTESWPTYIFEISNNDNISVKAFPNPFNDVTNIVVTGLNQKFGFELYDVTGRLQQSIPSVDNNQFQVHKGQLAGGVYLYRIIVADKPAAYGKLVVE